MRVAVRSRKGFALLAVLWTMALLAVIVTRLAAAAHTETRIAVNLRRAAEMREAADGAVHVAAVHVLDRSEHHWNPHATPGPHLVQENGTEVEVWLRDESDLIDINSAPPEMLATALVIVGLEPPKAEQVAAALVAWRMSPTLPVAQLPGRAYAPPGEAFRDIDEILMVPGMTRDLLDKLAPHLTLYSAEPPASGTRDMLAAATLRRLHAQTGYEPPPRLRDRAQVVRVVATARGEDGAGFTRTAILRLDPATVSAPLTILQWN